MTRVISPSPHLKHSDTTRGIMLDVIIALLPATVIGIIFFGWRAAVTIVTCVTSAVLAEWLWCLVLKKKNSVFDLSAVVTGLILGLNLSPLMPFWMAAIGSVFAIIVVKQFFGGLGQNFVNPAIAGRIVLMVSFASNMSVYAAPFAPDAVTSATPLSDLTAHNLKELFLGLHGGCIGETCAAALILGGLYLIARRVITPHIPVAFIGTVAILCLIVGDNPLKAVLSGGLLLGAIFMATDYVTSPTTASGKLIFGVGCGIITFVIRTYGSLPEGVSFAIILMNILTPHINTLCMKASKPFGWEGKKQ